MGTTAEKGAYLNTTKQKLKESINNIGGSITDETTFRAYAEELDNIYDNLPKTTGEGSNLSLSTIKGRINVDDILGDTQQFATTGKNYFMPTLKINNTNIIQQRCSVTLSGDEFTFVATGTDIYFGNVVAVGSSYGENCGVLIEIPTGVTKTTITTTNTAFDGLYYTFYDSDKKSLGYGRAYATGTNIVENAKYLGVRIGVATATSGTTYKTKVMVTFGNVDNTYEPYTNGASPNPTYPQPINVVTGQQEVLVRGKNLFDRANATEEAGIKWADGTILTGSTYANNIVSDYIELGGITNIVGNYAGWYFFYDKNKNYLGQGANVIKQSGGGFRTSIAIPYSVNADIYYVRLQYRGAENDNVDMNEQNIMLNIGTTVSTWQPYQSQTKIVNLSSKNLLGLPNGTYSNNGITAVVNNGTITLNGTASGTSFVAIPLVQEITLSNSAITLSTNNEATGGDNLTEIRVYTSGSSYLACSYNTINNSTTYTNKADTYLRLQIRTSSGISYSDFVLKPQLEYGSSATTYEPYYNYELGGIGTYQDRISKSSGKNLFNYELFNAFTTSIQYVDLTLEPNTTYTMSTTLPITSGVGSNLFFMLGGETASSSTNGVRPDIPRTLTTDSTGTVRVGYRTNTGVGENPKTTYVYQIEKGTSATSYEPYGSDKWYIEKNIGKVVYTGASSENWTFSSGSIWKYRIDITNSLLSTSDTSKPLALSNYYTGGIWNSSTNYQIGSLTSISSTLAIRNDDISSLVDFKTWLSTHNTEVRYILATPTYTEITNETLIAELNEIEKMMSYNGQTNISISGNLPMILSVSALKGESE